MPKIDNDAKKVHWGKLTEETARTQAEKIERKPIRPQMFNLPIEEQKNSRSRNKDPAKSMINR